VQHIFHRLRMSQSRDNMKYLSGTFVPEAMNTWKPCKYDHRLKVTDAVEKLKTKIRKQNITELLVLYLSSTAGKNLDPLYTLYVNLLR
jgi:hypothetical protein